MYQLLSKKQLAEDIYRIAVHAPRVAQKRKAGQFVIVRICEEGERIPLTIADSDPQALSITLVFKAVGESTQHLAALEPGDEILDVVGPLGRPTELGDHRHAVCVGGGLGIALIWPIARALRTRAPRLTGIISAQRADLLIMQEELAQLCDHLIALEPSAARAKLMKATALEALAENLLTATGRNYYLTSAQELRKAAE